MSEDAISSHTVLASINREVAARLQSLWLADVFARAALPRIRVETPIGSQAEFEIAN